MKPHSLHYSFPFFVSLLGASIAGLAPIFVRLSEVGSTATGFYRFFLSIPLLWVWKNFTSSSIEAQNGQKVKQRPKTKREYALIILTGTLFGVDVAMWNYSIVHTTVANASMLANLSSLYVAVLSWVIFKERLEKRFILGLLLALGGSSILIGLNLNFNFQYLLGDFCALMASVTFGNYMLLMRELRKTVSTPSIMTLSASISALVLFIISMIMGDNFFPQTNQGWVVLFGLAWVTMALGHGLVGWAAAYVPPIVSTVGMLIQPVISTGIAWFLFGERLNSEHLVGVFIILIGIAMAGQQKTSKENNPIKKV
jgi:drug/metabolite transporter (DMT)-like permease